MNLMNKPMLATGPALEQAYHFEFVPTMEPIHMGSVAIIPIEGLLSHRFTGFGSSYEFIHAQLQSALDNPNINHIVLDIDSGGGEVSGLFDLVDFIVEARVQKPITALVNEHAYSAAYLIASSASKIVAPQTAGVGSIGVIVAHVDQSEAEKKVGLKVTEIYSGKHKVDFSPHQPLSEDAKLQMQTQVNDIYELFLQYLAKNRNSLPSLYKDTEAKTFNAQEALSLTLIDEIESPFKYLKELMMTEKTFEEEVAVPDPKQILAQERDRVKSIVEMCQLANMPECAEQFMQTECSVEQARKILFEKMIANSAEPIINAVKEQPAENKLLLDSMVQGLKGAQHARV